MKVLLDITLRRFFPKLEFICIQHEGKTDLERSLRNKLENWDKPDDRFVIVEDSDGGDCRKTKSRLVSICKSAGRESFLVRIACQELEAWYFGDPSAMASAFDNPRLADISKRARFRDPDAIPKPSQALARLHPAFQKIGGARRMASYITYRNNKSRSFCVFVQGVAKLSKQAIELK